MRMFIIVAVILYAVTTVPTSAEQPFPGFAERLTMGCSHKGVTNVYFTAKGRLKGYRHQNKSSKAEIVRCLLSADARLRKERFPDNGPRSTDRFTILPNGDIKLHYSSF